MISTKYLIVGTGATGSRAIAQLISFGADEIVVCDTKRARAERIVHLFQKQDVSVQVVADPKVVKAKVAVLAHSGLCEPAVSKLIDAGTHVVTTSDSLSETPQLLRLHDEAQRRGVNLIVGAGVSPGLTGLLVHEWSRYFDQIDEVHVALHGTGGPECAHQHHDSLARQSIGWHEGEWLHRPSGSGRELCWFPDPVGPHDCYRAGMSDPVILRRVFPELNRITARRSATRRDRLTARLPMMSPPHKEGGLGGVRVEVRGWRARARETRVVGVVAHIAQIAGTVAGAVAFEAANGGIAEPGVTPLGVDIFPNQRVLRKIQESGIEIQEFVGI